jgi:hypothetical protein
MKNFKVFTVAMLFLAGVTTTFTSCGGGEDKEEDKENTEASSEETTETEEAEVEEPEVSETDDCLGDYFGLQSDLTDLFMANVKSGAIVVGTTTKAEMESMTGDADGFDKEYDGLRVSGYYSYEGDVLQSISLDYFYECDGALDLLSVDKSSITSSINSSLGVDGVADGDYEDAGTEWSINGMTVRQANFSDGYGVYVDAEM